MTALSDFNEELSKCKFGVRFGRLECIDGPFNMSMRELRELQLALENKEKGIEPPRWITKEAGQIINTRKD